MVSRDAVIEFASRFDPQPFHLDDAAAEANPVFGRLAASAVHTLAMASRMMADRAAVSGFHPHAGLGMQELRALKPVYPGDTLSLRTEITALRASASRPDCGVVTSEVLTLNQHDEPVLKYIAVQLFKRRGTD